MDVLAQTLYSQPDTVIVWYFDENNWDLDDICEMHKQIRRQYPFNKVIALPSSSSIDLFEKEELIEILTNAIKYIEDNK